MKKTKKKKHQKKKNKKKMLLHDCKRVFQEMWELYDVTVQVIFTFKLM